ncbi:hypothetical protein AMS68_001185 [Peltaster fructicola]|uniref:Uncharacterized protein n=1 Tax=Peltaster fructicola TaxID=286661 RepID=A0A6H0XM20_9PEZI|nr:hypothetical protein AMS68_001185 [Peltaster fructicola]
MAATGLQKYRSFIFAGSAAALASVGAITGATLKSDTEKRAVVQASPTERLQQMETLRQELTNRKLELEIKISHVEERARAKALLQQKRDALNLDASKAND